MLRFVGVFLALASASALSAPQVSLFPGAGLPPSSYEKLKDALNAKFGLQAAAGDVAELCVGHSSDGAKAALRSAVEKQRCSAGLILLGAAPLPEDLDSLTVPVLVVAGELDGVVPLSHFAVSRSRSAGVAGRRFVALRGASHFSFAHDSAALSAKQSDLKATAADHDVHALVAELAQGFLAGGRSEALATAEKAAAELAGPIETALRLEGSEALGQVACNSDFPTNPTCQYTKWPDHSLPFGPAPAPSPPLPSDCVCGSEWISKYAAPLLSGLPDSVTATVKDAFHDVSDTHPFHLPHIFNECDSGSSACVLNVTTLTMPVVKTGDFWPSDAAAPVSAFELRSKLKSREAMWTAAHLPGSNSSLDKDFTLCMKINQAALDYAKDHAETGVRRRYDSQGEPLVMVEDKTATIGITGPEWIKDELVFERKDDANSPTGSRVEVQSWLFNVANTFDGNVPWFYPVGMHYCKLLSPARAMEWIYTGSLHKSAKSAVIV